jgi:hypothetical protein
MRRFLSPATGLVLAWILIGAGRAAAIAPEVRDAGSFFSPEAVKKANEAIREIMRKHGIDLLIETFAAPSSDQAAKVKAMSREEREVFFEQWAKQRIEATAANGVYILICKDPPHFRVEITGKGRSIFDRRARDQLVRALGNALREKKNDQALEEVVKLVRERLAASGGDREAERLEPAKRP